MYLFINKHVFFESKIQQGSPVQAFLPVRAIITQIDDTPLASTKRSSDIWTSYALDNHKHGNAEDLGWCMNSAWFLSQSILCHDMNRTLTHDFYRPARRLLLHRRNCTKLFMLLS